MGESDGRFVWGIVVMERRSLDFGVVWAMFFVPRVVNVTFHTCCKCK